MSTIEATESKVSYPEATPVRIIRFGEVIHKTGLSKREIYSRISQKRFPAQIALGPRAIGFIEHEVNGWIEKLVRDSRAGGAK